MKKIFLIAGEPSGDILGAKLMAAIKTEDQDISFYGIGGEQMTKQGLDSLFDMQELSIMGFIEIITHLPRLIKKINFTIAKIKEIAPDIVVTIDSPGFCFRVASKLQNLNITLVHYVAPSVWAYKPKRAKKVAKLYDHLLTLLPFEPEYFIKEGMDASFIGHPIIEDHFGRAEDFRTKHQLSINDKILCIMPGSRNTELDKLLPIFVDTASILIKENDNLKIVVITLPHLVEKVSASFQAKNLPHIMVCDSLEKKDALAASSVALVKSGTSSLEVAFAKIPMVVAYKINAISAWILKLLIKIPYVSLINIILNKPTIPELLQDECNALNLSKGLDRLLKSEKARNQQISDFAIAFKKLKNQNNSPSILAAKIILKLIFKS